MIGKTRTLLASTVGTALEFYDFMLYLALMEVIGSTFFPANDPSSSRIFGYLAFSSAYILRPFGAIVFGHIGDKFGRRIALILSVTLMGIPTLLIGIMPGFDTIGYAAPITLVTCRLIQGLCTGGEYNGSAIFALEHAGKSYPGMVGGFITGASIVGVLMAEFASLLLKKIGTPEWGWRSAFIFGAVISLVGLYIRIYTQESPEFQKLKSSKSVERSPLKDAIMRHWRASLTTISVGMLNGFLSYTLFKFLEIYLDRFFNVPDKRLVSYTIIGVTVYMFSAPGMGYLLDRFGGQKLMRRASLAVGIMGLVIFFLFQLNMHVTNIIAMVLMGLVVSSIASPQHAFVQTLFPAKDRYSGVAFNYCVGMGIGGPLSLPLVLWLTDQTGFVYIPAFFFIFFGLLCRFMIKWNFKNSQEYFSEV